MTLSLFVQPPYKLIMMISKRKYCSNCGKALSSKNEGDTPRDYCEPCNVYYYDNPLPVASNTVQAPGPCICRWALLNPAKALKLLH